MKYVVNIGKEENLDDFLKSLSGYKIEYSRVCDTDYIIEGDADELERWCDNYIPDGIEEDVSPEEEEYLNSIAGDDDYTENNN